MITEVRLPLLRQFMRGRIRQLEQDHEPMSHGSRQLQDMRVFSAMRRVTLLPR